MMDRYRLLTYWMLDEHGEPVATEDHRQRVFGGPLDGQGARYSSRALAEAGHRYWCERLRTLLLK